MNRAMYDQRNKQEWIRTGSAPAEQYWRPFQIAFILMNLRGLGDANCPERELADLLWFPTGGGKTEAYLGLIGFAILLRRIRNPKDGGVSVLMRYTLRLLTLQQFETGGRPDLRPREDPTPGDAAPPSRSPSGSGSGRRRLRTTSPTPEPPLNKLKKGETVNEDNPMQLTRCPWCGTALTPDDYRIQQYPRVPDDDHLPQRRLRLPRRYPGVRCGLGCLRRPPLAGDRHCRQVRHDGLAGRRADHLLSRRQALEAGPDRPGRAASDQWSPGHDGRSVRDGGRCGLHERWGSPTETGRVDRHDPPGVDPDEERLRA